MRVVSVCIFAFCALGCVESNLDPTTEPVAPVESAPSESAESDAGFPPPTPSSMPHLRAVPEAEPCTVTELTSEISRTWHEVRDSAGRIVMQDEWSGGALLLRMKYSYDDQGRLVRRDETPEGYSQTFSYEPGKMTSTNATGSFSETYSMDDEWRITVGPSVTLTYDAHGFVRFAKIDATNPMDVWSGTWTSTPGHVTHYAEERYGGARCNVDWTWSESQYATIVSASWGTSPVDPKYDRCIYHYDAGSNLDEAECTLSSSDYARFRFTRESDGSTLEEIATNSGDEAYRYSPSCQLGLSRFVVEHSLLGVTQVWDPRVRAILPVRALPAPTVRCFPDWGSI